MEKIKRTRPSKSVTFTLNPKNPNEAKLIELLEKRVSVRTSSYKHALGTELIRELVLMGMEAVEKSFPAQFQTAKPQMILKEEFHSKESHSIIGAGTCDLSGTSPL